MIKAHSNRNNRIAYTSCFDDIDEADYQDEIEKSQEASKCNFDIEILYFLIESFTSLFPTKDCCHGENGVGKYYCTCVPCGDNLRCQSCFPGTDDYDADYEAESQSHSSSSQRGSVGESKGELDESTIIDDNQYQQRVPYKQRWQAYNDRHGLPNTSRGRTGKIS